MKNAEFLRDIGWPQVAIDFLELFARAEGALKKRGFLKDKKLAEADWSEFAMALGEEFFNHVKASQQAETIVGEPPRRRLRRGLEWHPNQPLPVTNVDSLFRRGICQVRNNLIHGEKFAVDGKGRERDVALVSESFWVLQRALEMFRLFDV